MKPLVHRDRTDLVRFVKNDNLAAVDARPVEQLEYDLEQRASGTGADEPMPQGKGNLVSLNKASASRLKGLTDQSCPRLSIDPERTGTSAA